MKAHPEPLCMSDASDSGDSLMSAHTTGADRVRMVARQLSEPRTVNWIASEAEWSHEPTKRVIKRLVDDGILRRDESGSHTTYYPDYRQQAIQEATRLRDSDHSVEELTDRLAEMNDQISEWKAEFDVESPNQLRATVADTALSAEARSHRREIARQWERLAHRIEIVSFAIREWEFLAPSTDQATAGN